MARVTQHDAKGEPRSTRRTKRKHGDPKRKSHARHRATAARAETTTSSDAVAEEGAELSSNAWPELVPLDGPPVPAFPVDALPPVVANMVRDVARVTQTPCDLPALCGLVVLGACVSRRVDVAIGLSSNPTHIEPLNVYGAGVAASGTRKGPVQRAMSGPLRTLEVALRAERRPEIEEAQRQRKFAEKRLDRLMEQAAKEEDQSKREELEDKARRLKLPAVPALPKLVVGDRTPEKLEMDLAEQGSALLLEDEEAGTLFAIAMGRYSHDGAVQLDVYLKAYDRGPLDTGRVVRDLVHVDTAELSINIMPQPVIVERLRARPELHDRGFLPRFLFAVPPSLVGSRSYDARVAPTATIRTAYDLLVQRLCALPKYSDGKELPHLELAGEGLAVWKRYSDRVESEMRDGGRLAPISEWASKQAGRVGRFAGILHLARTVSEGTALERHIPAATVHAACRLGEYFEAHALVAYDLMRVPTELDGARRIVAWIRRRTNLRILRSHSYVSQHGKRSRRSTATGSQRWTTSCPVCACWLLMGTSASSRRRHVQGLDRSPVQASRFVLNSYERLRTIRRIQAHSPQRRLARAILRILRSDWEESGSRLRTMLPRSPDPPS